MRSIKVTSTTSSWIKPVLELISLLDSNSVFAKMLVLMPDRFKMSRSITNIGNFTKGKKQNIFLDPVKVGSLSLFLERMLVLTYRYIVQV